MYILYVDESGVEDLGSGTSHFVLLGLVIPGDPWKPLDDVLDRIKATPRSSVVGVARLGREMPSDYGKSNPAAL